MDALVKEQLPSAPATDRTIRVLAAGNDGLRRAVAAALDATDVALVDTAATPEAVMEKLALGDVDCVVVDKAVGSRNSLELYEQVASKHRSPPAMILLSDDASAKTVLKAFRTGLSDCVARDHDFGNELRQAIRRSVERTRKQREVNEEIDYLAKLAKSDRLTGLPNRTFIDERLASVAASSERYGGTFGVFLIDIDNFRQINDVYGHAVGDLVLKAFARRLMLTSRASDSFARFGGDEFLYMIDRAVTNETMTLVAERLVSALRFTIDLEAVGLSLSASIGAAIFPSDAASPDALVATASRATQAAKTRSRRYCLAHEAAAALPDDILARAVNAPELRSEAPPTAPHADSGPLHREENRRVEHRNRVFKRGRIVLGDGYSTMDCVVRDLSLRGARISVEDQVTLPPRFSFALVDTGTTYPAVRRWQRGKSIGIEFWAGEGKAAAAASMHG